MDTEEGNNGDSPPVCANYKRMLEEFDYEGVANHLSKVCTECAELALNFYANGRDLLFKDRLPSWLQKAKDEEEAKAAAEMAAAEERARIEQRATKIKPKTDGPRNAEEIEKYIQEMNMKPGITDASLGWEIRKLKRVTEEEARSEVIKLRQLRNEIRKGQNAEKAGEPPAKKRREDKIPFKEKGAPWLPAVKDHFPPDKRSVLTDVDQTRYMNILSTLVFIGQSRFTQNKEEIKTFDKILEEERQALDNIIVEQLNPLQLEKFPVPSWMNTYCRNRARRRWISVYGMRFYNEAIESINWDEAIPPELSAEQKKIIKVEEILANGRIDRVRIPDLHKQLQLVLHSKEIEKKYSIACSNRFPIEEDRTALDYCLDKNISIAMDASTACYLMTRSFLSKPHRPRFTVTVKQIIHQGAIRKVAFISKPKIAGAQSSFVFLKNYAKYAFKAMYVDKRRADQPSQPTLLKEIDDRDNAPMQVDNTIHVAEDVEMSEGTSKQADPLDFIMGSISKEDATVNTPKNPTGKRYSVFRIGSQNVLIRSSAPVECQMSRLQTFDGKPISLDLFIEMLPTIGACRLDTEEFLFNYCKQIFKVAEGHAIVRIAVNLPHHPPARPPNSVHIDVLQIHRLTFFNDQKSAEIEKEIMNMFAYRAHCLEELLNQVASLEQGYFLLYENNKRMHISKEKLDTVGTYINFEKQQLIRPEKNFPPFPEVFSGIDHRIFLQWQIYVHRVPGSFMAADCPIAKILNKETGGDEQNDKNTSKKYRNKRLRKNRAKRAHAKKRKAAAKQSETIDIQSDDKEISEDDESSEIHSDYGELGNYPVMDLETDDLQIDMQEE